jgi:arginine:pyruvate transaminase
MTARPHDPATGMPLSSLGSAFAAEALDGWRVHTRANKAAAAGEDVIILSVGDPDFDTPAPIVERTIAALHEGRTHYTPAAGIMPLRKAIAEHETVRLARPVTVDETIVCAGAQNALYAAMRCIVDPGDEVLLLSPPYTMFDGVVRAAGGTPVHVPLDKANGYRLDGARLAEAVTQRTRAILLNSPHNPSGAVVDAGELDAITDLCVSKSLWLVSDEVYADLSYDAPFVSPSTRPGMRERTVIVRSLSKSHAMSGWRVGWGLAPRVLATLMEELLNHTQYGGPAFIQLGAVVGLTEQLPEVAEMKRIYRARRDVVCEAFGAIPGVTVVKPASGLFCIMDVSGLGLDALELAERLFEAERVSILPGNAFGTEHGDWMRLALCQPDLVIREAAARMARFVASGLARPGRAALRA